MYKQLMAPRRRRGKKKKNTFPVLLLSVPTLSVGTSYDFSRLFKLYLCALRAFAVKLIDYKFYEFEIGEQRCLRICKK